MRIAARPRPRPRRPRDIFQVLTAVGTVLAGLMSVPAIAISMNALRVSQKQEQAAQKAQEEAKKQALAEEAKDYAERVTAFVVDGSDLTVVIRNANSSRIYLWVVAADQRTKQVIWVGACRESTAVVPMQGVKDLRFVLENRADKKQPYWRIFESSPNNTPVGTDTYNAWKTAYSLGGGVTFPYSEELGACV